MAFDLQAVVEAAADQIRQRVASNVNCYWWHPIAPELPAVIVTPPPGAEFAGYHASFGAATTSPSSGALCDVVLRVQMLTSAADAQAGHRRLYAMLSAGAGQGDSVVDALEDDRTFGRVVDESLVSRGRWLGPVSMMTDPVIQAIGAELDVAVWLTR